MSPKVSVIIPTFNRAELLRKALESVVAQEGGDFEIIVSDNCSADHTQQVVAEFAGDPRIVYSRNESNIGMVRNWRRGIYEIARGEWFMLMSDDDFLCDPHYLADVCGVIDRHAPVFIYSGGEVYDIAAGSVERVRPPFDGLVPGELVFATRGTMAPQDVLLPTMVFRRADASRLGFLDDPDNLSCDSELYLKLCAEGWVYAFARSACVYVKHGENLIYRIKATRRLLAHNLDHLVNPFAYARERDMPATSLASFRRNVQLDRAIATTFLRLRLHNKRWLEECRARVVERVPDVVADVEASSFYRTRSVLLAVAGPMLRVRYPLEDSGSGVY